jgi:hypothetical protein
LLVIWPPEFWKLKLLARAETGRARAMLRTRAALRDMSFSGMVA